ncbi:MAG: hypothetical protein ACTHW1_07500 [Ancrocorticia sp.]|uniref:hypothetical protein n=1 Tax=Ancrocorticia sp. TaxID=2593684 RepID=UPI003F8EEC10
MKLKKLSTLLMIPALAVALSACGGGEKPTKEEVTNGLSSAMEGQIDQATLDQLGGDALDNYYSCIVDGSYDDLSDDTLRSLADGEDPSASTESDDYKVFNDAVNTCAQSLMDEALSNLEG